MFLHRTKRATQTIAKQRLLSTKSGFIHEVCPRDGLQNEKQILSLPEKIKAVELLTKSNPFSIEVASFVRPDLVPAMASSYDLCLALRDQDWAIEAKKNGIGFAGLVPNMKGFETFMKARGDDPEFAVLDTVVCLVSCTESFSQNNVRLSKTEALKRNLEIISAAHDENLKVYAYVAMAFGCPFEGKVPAEAVLELVEHFNDKNVHTIGLGDTFGRAEPDEVDAVLKHVIDAGTVDVSTLSMHMHDSHGLACENIQRGINYGIQQFDSSNGGCGGCNFVPNAKGELIWPIDLPTEVQLSIYASMECT